MGEDLSGTEWSAKIMDMIARTRTEPNGRITQRDRRKAKQRNPKAASAFAANRVVTVGFPQEFMPLLAQAFQNANLTRSAYIRRAVVAQMSKDLLIPQARLRRLTYLALPPYGVPELASRGAPDTTHDLWCSHPGCDGQHEGMETQDT